MKQCECPECLEKSNDGSVAHYGKIQTARFNNVKHEEITDEVVELVVTGTIAE